VRRVVLPLVVAVAVLIALPAIAAGSDRTAVPRIVGGEQSTRAWPAQGALRINGAFACGGTLVSGRWFVTAAHCVTLEDGDGDDIGTRPASAFTVRLGSSNRNSGGQILGVTNVVRSSAYSHETFQNDIALLRLSAVPSSTSVEPLRIVTTGESALWAADEPATIIGWGTRCASLMPVCSSPTLLHEAVAPVRDDAFCQDGALSYGTDLFDVETMVCAGDGSTDTCRGDSGGPLMVPRVDAWVIVGITSWGISCADPEFPGIYTRLGAPNLNGWLRDLVPTATISPSAFGIPPAVGSDVGLQATGDPGAHVEATPAFRWDLDDDGAFDDATGPTAQLSSIAAGSHVVRARQIYPDGDCAIAREVITTNGSTPPVPSDPQPRAAPFCPPAPVKPVPPPPPAPPPAPPLPPLAEVVSIPKRIKVSSLLDRKMVIRVRCRGGCYAASTLTLDAKTSRKVRLTRRRGKTKRIASGDNERLTAGTVRVTLRLSRSTIKRLRRARSGTLTLRVKVTDDDEHLKFFKVRIKLRR